MSEASVQKLKSLAARVRASEPSGINESEISNDTNRDPDDISLADTSDTVSESPSKRRVNYYNYA